MKPQRITLLLLLLLSLALHGCMLVREEGGDAVSQLDHADMNTSTSPDSVDRLLHHLTTNTSVATNSAHALLFQAMQALMDSPHRQEARAITLLQQYLKQRSTDETSPHALLARLLLQQLQNKQGLRRELISAQQERDAAQQQLEALKAIEQQIRAHPQTNALELER